MIGRRRFLRDLAFAGAAGALGYGRELLAAEPPPETKRLRIAQIVPGNCYAPQYMAEDMLRGEGFSELQYVPLAGSASAYVALGKGAVDVSMAFSSGFVIQADAGAPVTMLAGIHPGCQELFASSRIRSIRDLKGRSVAVAALNNAQHGFLTSIVGHVGLDPRRDINWVVLSEEESIRQLADGKVDAFIASPPSTYEVRARRIGHVLVNMTTDRPWSHYFCCVLTGNREFVRKNPVATKRAMRAILKGASLCADAGPAAKHLVSRGFYNNHDIALQMLRDVPYSRWRDYDTEDTVRFYALRLNEAGMIKSSPQKILSEATDFRFLNELKKELKT